MYNWWHWGYRLWLIILEINVTELWWEDTIGEAVLRNYMQWIMPPLWNVEYCEYLCYLAILVQNLRWV